MRRRKITFAFAYFFCFLHITKGHFKPLYLIIHATIYLIKKILAKFAPLKQKG